LHLNRGQEELLRGDGGVPEQIAMELLTKYGDSIGAESLVAVKSAHLGGSSPELTDVGIGLLGRLASSGKGFRVPTSCNPAAIDLATWEGSGVSAGAARDQLQIRDGLVRMGVIRSWTNVPFQVCNFPKPGEPVSWGDRGAAIFANSVLGCRTNCMAAGPGIASAFLGLAPSHGLLLEEERRAGIACSVPDVDLPGLDYGSLGYLIGKVSGARIPAVLGIPRSATSDDLKHLGAAAGSAGRLSMICYAGVSEGWASPQLAAGWQRLERLEVQKSDIDEAGAELTQAGEPPDLVALGSPHLSVTELGILAKRLEGRKVRPGVRLQAFTSLQAHEMASASGIRADIESAGGELWGGVDPAVAPLSEMGFHVVLTDSAYLAATLMSARKVKVRYAPLSRIIGEVTD